MAPIRLYTHPISGHGHRVELCLSLLGLPYEVVVVNLSQREHKTPDFLKKNHFGQVPVLEDGELTLADSNAILVYLAERYDREGTLWPAAPELRAAVVRWLSVAAGQLAYGPSAARRAKLLGAKLDYEAAVQTSNHLFGLIEKELATHPFLVGATPTLADLALYAYVERAPEGDLSLDPYPNIRQWLARLEALPRFVPMHKSK